MAEDTEWFIVFPHMAHPEAGNGDWRGVKQYHLLYHGNPKCGFQEHYETEEGGEYVSYRYFMQRDEDLNPAWLVKVTYTDSSDCDGRTESTVTTRSPLRRFDGNHYRPDNAKLEQTGYEFRDHQAEAANY
jgi:hypothetical protein